MFVSHHAAFLRPVKTDNSLAALIPSHHVWLRHSVMATETLAPSLSTGNSQQFVYRKLLWIKSVRQMTNRELLCTMEDTCTRLHRSDYRCYTAGQTLLSSSVL